VAAVSMSFIIFKTKGLQSTHSLIVYLIKNIIFTDTNSGDVGLAITQALQLIFYLQYGELSIMKLILIAMIMSCNTFMLILIDIDTHV
jgi:hypothetical protein